MSSTARVSSRPTSPSPAATAQLVHAMTADATSPEIIGVEVDDPNLSVLRWRLRAAPHHPADALLGLVAPASWRALGLIISATARPMTATGAVDQDPSRAEPVHMTVLADRSGAVASVIERLGSDPELLESPPSGWVADLMARSLGRPTEAPDRLGRYIELLWLDAIAAEVFANPSARFTWNDLARLHPAQPPGRALEPTLLAAETEAAEDLTSWERIRARYRAAAPAMAHLPPGAARVGLSRWFDDGSFSRWIQRDLPPAEVIWPAVCEALSPSLGPKVAEALLTI